MSGRWMMVALPLVLLVYGLRAEEKPILSPKSDEKPPPLEKKVDAPATPAAADAKDGKPAEKTKSFDEIMRDATALARKNLKSAVDKVLPNHPDMTPELRTQMSSQTQQDRWIDQSRSAAREQAKLMSRAGNDKATAALAGNNWSDPVNKDVKGLTLAQKLEYDAVASWTEQKSISWLEQTMSVYDQERKARLAAAEAAKKGKKGGENTAPPNGGLIDGPLGPLTR